MKVEYPGLNPTNLSEEVLVLKKMRATLERCAPYPGDERKNYPIDPSYKRKDNESRFEMDLIDLPEYQLIYVYDRLQGFEAYLSWSFASWNQFSVGKWYTEQCAINNDEDIPTCVAHEWMKGRNWTDTTLAGINNGLNYSPDNSLDDDHDSDSDNDGAEIMLNGIQVDRNKYESIQRNASRVRGVSKRLLPKPVVINMKINELPV